MSIFVWLSLILFSWVSVKLWSNSVDARVNKDPPIPDPPNSSDVQRLTEALYFDKHIVYDHAFPRDKKPVDVCALSADKAMKVCLKLEQLFKYRGSYFTISDKNVAECKTYQLKLHHTLPNPDYEDVQARACPFQPNPLFLLSGTTRVPVFSLTWSGDEKTHLHLDFYLDVDENRL